ncbi:hypothetical protein MPSEU_000304900 [Mayamaea pseudoterrestris]|nr:hypothetical protein MPSEU_000304900 [Mayamaea pseudoterrestris]
MPFRILTVGDGDLSCSLALQRAYGSQVELVASTLLSPSELQATYQEAASNFNELLLGSSEIKYSVDATLLHEQIVVEKEQDRFNIIMFHHPHLGSYDQDEHEHVQQHTTLMSHYIYSALALLKPNGCVHLCLCNNQEYAWRLRETCERLGVTITDSFSASRPIFSQFIANEPVTKAPRRYRSGKFGSKHWLSNYGYRHQLTFPQRGHEARSMNVSASKHYFIQPMTNSESTALSAIQVQASSTISCNVCAKTFKSEEQLNVHLRQPARPPAIAVQESIPLTLAHTVATTTDQPANKVSPSVEHANPSTDSICSTQQCTTVSMEHERKRLRWFLQNVMQAGSKRTCEHIIHRGSVLVNECVATDASRILLRHHVVRISEAEVDETTATTVARPVVSLSDCKIRQVAAWSHGRVVLWKPVGMRTSGAFDANSLESVYNSMHANEDYVSLTKLDRGCSGLVLLQKQSAEQSDVIIELGFSVLVHGAVPDSWLNEFTINVPVDAARRWKKPAMDPSTGEKRCTATARVMLLEKSNGIPLSTLSITTSSTASGMTNPWVSSRR